MRAELYEEEGVSIATGWVVLIAVTALLVGTAGGFFLARKYMQNYFKKSPPVNKDMLHMTTASMGQKPSEKKVRQVIQQMKNQGK